MSNNRVAYFKSVSVASGENAEAVAEIDESQVGDGASISGAVTRASTSYDIELVWQDKLGNDVITESQSTGNAAGTTTTFDVAARSPRCKVRVKDAGSGSGAVDGSVYIG